ncbi:hypothetical protein PL81_00875, partial [Streptomyces sp. RSD-27]
FPARLDLSGIDLADAFDGGPAAGRALKAVKEQVRAVAGHGVGHRRPAGLPEPRIAFTYLDRTPGADLPGDPAHPEAVPAPDAQPPAAAGLEIDAAAVAAPGGTELTATFALVLVGLGPV